MKDHTPEHKTKDMWRFILLRGVIGWGISTAVLFQLIMSWISDVDFFEGIQRSMIIFPLGGILFGYLMWAASQNASRSRDDE